MALGVRGGFGLQSSPRWRLGLCKPDATQCGQAANATH